VESEPGHGSTFSLVIPWQRPTGGGQITDPLTRLLTWEHFLTHLARILLMHQRLGKQFGLLRLALGQADNPEEVQEVMAIIKGLVRKHEILSRSKEGFYYLVTFETDRENLAETARRFGAALYGRGHEVAINTVIYREDGENIEQLLGVLNS